MTMKTKLLVAVFALGISVAAIAAWSVRGPLIHDKSQVARELKRLSGLNVDPAEVQIGLRKSLGFVSVFFVTLTVRDESEYLKGIARARATAGPSAATTTETAPGTTPELDGYVATRFRSQVTRWGLEPYVSLESGVEPMSWMVEYEKDGRTIELFMRVGGTAHCLSISD